MSSILYSKYSQSQDPESAYEVLTKKAEDDAAAAEAAKQEAEAAKQAEKEAAAAAKQAEKDAIAEAKAKEKAELAAAKEKEREEREKKKVAASVGNSVAGTVGREAGKSALSGFGSLGKKIGGSAFQKCISLHEVNLNCPMPPSIAGDTFKGVTATFMIPKGSQQAYMADKKWSKLTGFKEKQ